MAGRPRVELGFAPSDDAVFIRYTTRPPGERKVSAVTRELFARAQQRSVAEPPDKWNSRRGSNPDLPGSPGRHHALDHASKNLEGMQRIEL